MSLSSPPLPFSSLSRQRVSFAIVAQITHAIAQGTMPLGSCLPTEPQLMEHFGVGRNALREAIKILEAFGLVVIRRGSGTFLQDTCTFDLLAPLFLRLLWTAPSHQDLTDAFQALAHAQQALDKPAAGRSPAPQDETIFSQLVTLVHSLFRGQDAPAAPCLNNAPWTSEKLPASRRIFWQMVQDLADQTIAPGDKLPTEQALMERFSVSRNVVREAIKALEATGIVEIRRPEGTFVSPCNDTFPTFVDTGVYSRILAHHGSGQFLRLKICLRDAVFYTASEKASLEGRQQFSALSTAFAQLLQDPAPQLAACTAALDALNDQLSLLCANPLLQQTEQVILDISAQSRHNFLVKALQTGRQKEVAQSYLRDADILMTRDRAAIPAAMEQKLSLWLSLNIMESP